MTCVIGYVSSSGEMYLAADSNSESSTMRLTRSIVDPKIFRTGQMLVGTCGSPRIRQILRYHLTPPAHADGKTDFAYIVADFLPEVRKVLKEHGFTRVDRNEEWGGNFLILYRGTIYEVMGDFQVNVSDKAYRAIGSGANVAMGAMYAQRSDTDPKERMEVALAAAQEFAPGVRGPFLFERQPF